MLAGVQRGPLVQLKTSKSSARIDLADLGPQKVRQDILDAIVTRREQDFTLSGPARPEQAVVDRIESSTPRPEPIGVTLASMRS